MPKPHNRGAERESQRASVYDSEGSGFHLGGGLCLENEIGGLEGLWKVSLPKHLQRLPTSQSPSLRSVPR